MRPERGTLAARLPALLVVVAAFAVGLLAGRRGLVGAAGAPPRATFALVLYGAESGADSAVRALQAAEDVRWAGRPGRPGLEIVGAELLAAGGMSIHKQDTTAFSAMGLDIVEPGDDAQPVGFYLVRAPTRQAAMRLASESPHVRHGGRVVVRTIVRR